jgi:hypothetical protein
MNVLIFVMTMLMLLSIMTYARLETYRSSQVFQVLFENYMEKDERGYINKVALKTYDDTKGSTKESTGSKEKVKASPRISLSPLLKKVEKEKAPQEAASFTVLLKNLMTTLYAEQPFYQKIMQERPSFQDEIIAALIKSASELPKGKGLKNAADIANLKLDDDKLQDVFYKMLKGAPYKDLNQTLVPDLTKEVPKEEVQSDDDASDEPSIGKEAEEYRSQQGYFSLLDFLTMQSWNKVRVYLAPREVLQAIYRNDAIVNDVINKRNELYHQASMSDSEGAKSLSESFKNEFNNRQDPGIGDDVLDYTVTKTNPKKYE